MGLQPFTTLLARWYLRRAGNPEPIQRALLRKIVEACHACAVGRALGLRPGMTFEEYLAVSPRDYAFYRPFVQRVLDGEEHVFGREPITALGETSGSMGQPKMVPHTATSLQCFSWTTRLLLLIQLWHMPHYLPKFTRWLCITASSRVRFQKSVAIGFISGLIYQQAQSTRKLPVLPTPSIAAIENWDERIRQTAAEAVTQRVGTLMGVPAYLERFLAAATDCAGNKRLSEIWPLLDEVYYSGTGIDAHRAALQAHFDLPLKCRSLYMATEGMFAAELDSEAGGWMRLLPEMAVYTFRDVDAPESPLRGAWQLQPGRRYELFVTTRAGLCQYCIGDILEVDGTRGAPLRVRVAGRTGDEINIATEKLSMKQAQATVAELSQQRGISATRFLVVPDPTNPRRHAWVLEKKGATGVDGAAEQLDRILARINPSYAALRAGDAVLQMPRVVAVPTGAFDQYVQAGFARRGQFKFRHVFSGIDRLRDNEELAFVVPLLEGTGPDDAR
jgi:hypothetical protein